MTPHAKKLVDTLTRRSRLTNLAVFLLLGVCTLSLLTNLRYWLFPPTPFDLARVHGLAFSTVEWPATRSDLAHLIVVPCHAIWKGTDSWTNEDDWHLEKYQKGPGRVRAFYEHIERSAQLLDADSNSLLIFSGGQTKAVSTTTEAESYLHLAQAAGLVPVETEYSYPHARVTTENYAMDSYQNLLFSIARFREFTGHFPHKITIVGYDFKRQRFTELHRRALRWPSHKFEYVGLDPDHDGSTTAMDGEKQNGYTPYSLDLYGCHSMLLNKRRQRNPFARFHPYYTSCPEMGDLFDWCPDYRVGGENALFGGGLPWDRPTIAKESR